MGDYLQSIGNSANQNGMNSSNLGANKSGSVALQALQNNNNQSNPGNPGNVMTMGGKNPAQVQAEQQFAQMSQQNAV